MVTTRWALIAQTPRSCASSSWSVKQAAVQACDDTHEVLTNFSEREDASDLGLRAASSGTNGHTTGRSTTGLTDAN
jgi:hypothetical protein